MDMKHQLLSGDILTPQVTKENVLYKNLCTRIYFETIIEKKNRDVFGKI